MSISFDKYKEVEKKARERVVEMNTEKKQFDRETVFEIIQNLKNSTDLIDSIILVGITTGSRLIEILRISDYLKVVGNPHRVMIKSLAKGSGKTKEANLNKKVERSLLIITYKDLSDTINLIREQIPEWKDGSITNQQLSAKYDSRVNQRIKTIGLKGGSSYVLSKTINFVQRVH